MKTHINKILDGIAYLVLGAFAFLFGFAFGDVAMTNQNFFVVFLLYVVLAALPAWAIFRVDLF